MLAVAGVTVMFGKPNLWLVPHFKSAHGNLKHILVLPAVVLPSHIAVVIDDQPTTLRGPSRSSRYILACAMASFTTKRCPLPAATRSCGRSPRSGLTPAIATNPLLGHSSIYC